MSFARFARTLALAAVGALLLAVPRSADAECDPATPAETDAGSITEITCSGDESDGIRSVTTVEPLAGLVSLPTFTTLIVEELEGDIDPLATVPGIEFSMHGADATIDIDFDADPVVDFDLPVVGGSPTLHVEPRVVITTEGAGAHGIQVDSAGSDGWDGPDSGVFDVSGNDGGAAASGGDVGVYVCSVDAEGNCDASEVDRSEVHTVGDGAHGIFAQSKGGDGGAGDGAGGVVADAGDGGDAGSGGSVKVDSTANITTQGDLAYGIFAESRGGEGGAGGGGGALLYAGGGDGAQAGDGGHVSVTNHGTIQTSDSFTNLGDLPIYVFLTSLGIKVPTGETKMTLGPDGDGSHGIYARSRGGRGGLGKLGAGLIGDGGDGGFSSGGGAVDVVNFGQIDAAGKQSSAIFAESHGGGGGDGALGAGVLSFGGDAAAGGDGGAITVTNHGKLSTGAAVAPGEESASAEDVAEMYGGRGILAQSVGGGGGNGGSAFGVGAGNFALALGGDGGAGGSGGTVDVSSFGAPDLPDGESDIATAGSHSHGIQAQSIGGGGGSGGGAISLAIGANPDNPLNLSIAVGGSGGKGGDGDGVTVGNASKTSTKGPRAYGILAQSVGGGGGDGGYAIAAAVSAGPPIANLAVAVGGSGGDGGDGDQVVVDNDAAITTEGQSSHGIVAQSVARGGGNGGFAAAGTLSVSDETVPNLAVSVGGGGGAGGSSGYVRVTNDGAIETMSKALPEGDRVGAFGCNVEDASCEAEDPFDTLGSGSIGILAQSIGGGGGTGGYSFAGSLGENTSEGSTVNLDVAVGGGGGDGGSSGRESPVGDYLEAVSIENRESIDTHGTDSHGILAQSIGGRGGKGGASTAVGVGFGGASEKSWNVDLSVAVGGGGGDGNLAGRVAVANGGDITTREGDSRGIFAQSIGGGGGDGGHSFTASVALASKDLGHLATGTVSVGGKGGFGNEAENVTVGNGGVIETFGHKSDGILAQSIGGGGGNGGKANAFSLRLEKGLKGEDIKKEGSNWKAAVTVGGSGGAGNKGGEVHVDNLGRIETNGAHSRGIYAQSVGHGGGNGGEGVNGSGITIVDAAATRAEISLSRTQEGNKNKAKKALMGQLREYTFTVGGNGGISGHGDDVEVSNQGGITTAGVGSSAILAQSVGGGGGVAQGFVEGGTDANDGTGEGGTAVNGLTGKFAFGGKGGAAGDGGDVTVTNTATLFTGGIYGNLDGEGAEAHGIFAQSVGGGGGVAGNVDRSLAAATQFGDLPILGGLSSDTTIVPKVDVGLGLAFGQDGGGAGNGGDVLVTNTGGITTLGDDAHGIFAQSVGGGGGVAGGLGNADLPELLSFTGSVGGAGSAGHVSVLHQAGTITTSGVNAHGIFAQSAGGDRSTEAIDALDNLIATYPPALDTPEGVLGLELVSIRESLIERLVLEDPDDPDEFTATFVREQLLLLSLALPAGDTKDYLSAVLDGANEGGAVAVAVVGDVLANGPQAHGVYAQSLGGSGNGNIFVEVEGHVQGGTLGGVGVYLRDGTNNLLQVSESGVVTASAGVGDLAIKGTTGDETVENSGLVVGTVDLGAGSNAFDNLATGRLDAGTRIDLGAGATFMNHGKLAPGGSGRAVATELTGDLVQTTDGEYLVDADHTGGGLAADRVDVSGAATVAGLIVVNPVSAGEAQPGAAPATILKTGGALDRTGLMLEAPESLFLEYRLEFPAADEVALAYEIGFTGIDEIDDMLNPNQEEIGDVFEETLGSGPNGLGPIVDVLVGLTSAEEVAEAYDRLSPESLTETELPTLLSSLGFAEALLSCPAREGAHRFIEQRQCQWTRALGSYESRDSKGSRQGFRRKGGGLLAGLQWALSDDWFVGVGAGYDYGSIEVEDLSDTDSQQALLGFVVKRVFGGTIASGSLSVGYSWNDSKRSMGLIMPGLRAKADYGIALAAAHLRVEHAFELGSHVYLKPLIDGGATYTYFEGFKETGAGPANLNVESRDRTNWTARAALEIGGEWGDERGSLVRPYVRVGATHFFNLESRPIEATFEGAPSGSSPIRVDGTVDDTYYDASAGLEILGAKGITLKLEATGRYAEGFRSYGGEAKLSIPF